MPYVSFTCQWAQGVLNRFHTGRPHFDSLLLRPPKAGLSFSHGTVSMVVTGNSVISIMKIPPSGDQIEADLQWGRPGTVGVKVVEEFTTKRRTE